MMERESVEDTAYGETESIGHGRAKPEGRGDGLEQRPGTVTA